MICYNPLMKVKIKRIDKTIPLPVYETRGSVGFDILAREEKQIEPGSIELIPANVIVEVPEGYMLVVASRSSTPKRKGLLPPHGFGIIDHDYCGPQDEIKIQVYNFSDKPVIIEKGEKIAQGVFVRVDKFEWEEIAEMQRKSRGGFGSTCEEHAEQSEASIARVQRDRINQIKQPASDVGGAAPIHQ